MRGGPQSLFNPDPQVLFDMGAMQPIAVAAGQFWRLFTAMFLHAGLIHLLFNGWALWVFGGQVEAAYGRTWMLLIYLVSGFLATVASYAFGPANALAVGASGAIFGIFGAFIAYNYRRRHLALAAANLRMAMTLILLNLLLAFGFARIDWRAHIGGIIVGFLAGYAAEGSGSPAQRRAIQVFGFARAHRRGHRAHGLAHGRRSAIPAFDTLSHLSLAGRRSRRNLRPGSRPRSSP